MGEIKEYDVTTIKDGKIVRMTENQGIFKFGKIEWEEIKAGCSPELDIVKI